MEFQFLKKTEVIVLITVLVCDLTIAVLVDNDYVRASAACDTTVYSYCNESTNSSQANETLKSLATKADEILSQITTVCKEIDVSHYIH